MPVDATEIKAIASRMKKATTNRDVLALCEWVLKDVNYMTDARSAFVETRRHNADISGAIEGPLDFKHLKVSVCPVCETRRKLKTVAQRKWRKNRVK